MKSETEIIREICEYLQEHHFLFWRNNNVPILGRSMPKWCPKGLPDLFIVRDHGRLTGVEVKRPAGNDEEREKNGRKVRAGKVTQDQANFGYRLVAHGANYLVVRSLDELIRKL